MQHLKMNDEAALWQAKRDRGEIQYSDWENHGAKLLQLSMLPLIMNYMLFADLLILVYSEHLSIDTKYISFTDFFKFLSEGVRTLVLDCNLESIGWTLEFERRMLGWEDEDQCYYFVITRFEYRCKLLQSGEAIFFIHTRI